jgi:hypothetical protein
MQRKRDDPAGQGGAFAGPAAATQVSTLQLPGLDEGARFDRRKPATSPGVPAPTCQVLGRAGDIVIELSWTGQEPDIAWAGQLVRTILTK